MATVNVCDRCHEQCNQLVPVLGVDVCNACIEATKTFLRLSPAPVKRGIHNLKASPGERLKQAREAILRTGVADSTLIANATGEPPRRIYEALTKLARGGHLRALGNGRFTLPKAEAAE